MIVQAEKSTMELALDKRIFNVGKDLGNAGGYQLDYAASAVADDEPVSWLSVSPGTGTVHPSSVRTLSSNTAGSSRSAHRWSCS